MDKNAIKKYAVWARRELLSRVAQKALQYGVDGTTPADPDAEIINGRLLTAAEKSQRRALIDAIAADGYEQILEEAAYTWFNRFCALRFMEVNNYLPSHTRVFTDENNAFAPQILAEAIRIELPGLDRDLVYKYKEANDDDALYKYLLITQCNALKEILPGMFSEISGYTELLFPDNLLREGSTVEQMIAMIPEDDWRDEVQIIGWLYQYYNSEKKDAVFAALKKNVKISKDNIPAATQLFTPDWIVRYMVENSLGRLWVQGHPAAPIKAEWKYYLEDAAQTPEVEARLAPLSQSYAALTPEQLTCIDPCCGSGHILVYLFDVLMQIYTDYGYTSREAVESIVQNNLYGLDIDKRAAQLAYFAVMMTARRHDRGFLRHPVQPHVYAIAESNAVDKGAVEVFCNGDAKLTTVVTQILAEMQDAREYGSILTTTPQDWAALYARFDELGVNDPDNHSMEKTALLKLQNVVQAAEILSKQYWVTVTNPPYMGSSGMNDDLSKHVKKFYPDSKSDLFAVFIERCGNLTTMDGKYSMIVQPSFLFLSSFEKIRCGILKNNTISSMLHMGRGIFGVDFGSVSFTVCNKTVNGYIGKYYRLHERTFQYIAPQDIATIYLEARNHPDTTYDFQTYDTENERMRFNEQTESQRKISFTAKQDAFSKIPGSPIAYWASLRMLEAYDKGNRLKDVAITRVGLQTSDNNRFLRLWHECDGSNIFLDCKSVENSLKSDKKWYPHNKGGAYRKWYGNHEYVINYQHNGSELNNTEGAATVPKEYAFKIAITYSRIASVSISFRLQPSFCVFNSASVNIFPEKLPIGYLLGLLNAKVTEKYLSIIAPTLNTQPGDVSKLPIIEDKTKERIITQLVNENIDSSKRDWDSFETSWDFKRHPLV